MPIPVKGDDLRAALNASMLAYFVVLLANFLMLLANFVLLVTYFFLIIKSINK